MTERIGKNLLKGKKMRKEDVEKISCHVCQKMIPKAAALHSEGKEYVLYFCDIQCLDYWKEDTEKKEKQTQRK